MVVFLWILYLLAAAVRIFWWLLFRAGIKEESSPDFAAMKKEGISIVVCAHNNLTGLQQLIPVLAAQHYPLFEIIVVNDRSTDQTASWLEAQKILLPQLSVVSIHATAEDWNAKKYALQQGLKKAKHPWLALTDSDCIPLSLNWLNHIAHALSQPGKRIFLGYSPYADGAGLLNKMIQTETFFTACQYFSLARFGKTYMGVGRNLAYHRSFIAPHLDSFPYQNHVGGDDDLLINQLAEGTDAQTGTHPDSFVLTFPPKNWQSWWKQKRRHLSAGARYTPTMRCILGSYWLSASGSWLLFFMLCLSTPSLQLLPLVMTHLGLFVVGTITLWPVFRIFKAGRGWVLFLFWDFLYIASSSIIGFSTFLVKNRKWS